MPDAAERDQAAAQAEAFLHAWKRETDPHTANNVIQYARSGGPPLRADHLSLLIQEHRQLAAVRVLAQQIKNTAEFQLRANGESETRLSILTLANRILTALGTTHLEPPRNDTEMMDVLRDDARAGEYFTPEAVANGTMQSFLDAYRAIYGRNAGAPEAT